MVDLKEQLFHQKLFASKTLTIVAQMAKEIGFLPYSLVKYITCLLDGG